MSLIGPVTVSPIGGHDMYLLSMSGDEELGRLFEYNLELLSPIRRSRSPTSSRRT